MKKLYWSLLFAGGLSVSSAYAQDIRLGVKAGLSLTSFVGDDAIGTRYKPGFHGGGLLELSLDKNLSVQPELLVSMKGSRYENTNLRYNITYLDVPVMLKYKLDGLFLEVGPQFGFRSDSELKTNSASIKWKNHTRDVDLGYAVGLGYETPKGALVGLRYNGGATKLGYDRRLSIINLPARNIYNSAIQLYVGYMFGRL
ncbi:PorT family protein [Hymenobacter sp. BT507]|uniref:PorT family protein n=1 Tax=Hymenobacter citatus TaxID=2763506 RepID=A0ABR7MQX5_9BACT|nr:porin family protein [Hymenobacter citatus]MBC6613120.1 PorT family protein [Hymenobacter citatus]